MNLRLKRPITAIIAILFSIALLGIGSFAYYHSSQGRIKKVLMIKKPIVR